MTKKKTDETSLTVDSFVAGRQQVNAGNRAVNSAKLFFKSTKRTRWESPTHIVTLDPSATRVAFNKEAFIAAHGIAEYERFMLPTFYDSFEVKQK